MDCGVYTIDSVYVELPEVPQPFGVVHVNAVVKTFRFIMKQSYICALIAMMVSPASQSGHGDRSHQMPIFHKLIGFFIVLMKSR